MARWYGATKSEVTGYYCEDGYCSIADEADPEFGSATVRGSITFRIEA